MSNISVTLKLIDQMSQKLNEIAGNGDRVAERIGQVGTSADDAFSRATSGTQQFSDSMQNASNAASNYAEQGDRARQSLDDQASTAERAAEEVGEFGDEAEEAGDQSEDFGNKASKSALDIGDALAAAGIVAALNAIKEAYFACDDAADSFETAMAKVGTIVDEEAISLEDVEGQIKQLSSETGVAVNDLAEATYSAISASVDSADAVGFVAQANALAVGGFTQSATAVDVLTTAINAYGLSADQAQSISDKLITTQNLGKTTVDELAQSLGAVIPTAATFNVNLDNLSSAYVTLTRNGINTANATTMINGMLSELGDSGSDVATILKEQTGKSFATLMEEGNNLGDVMQILGESVNGNSVAFMNLWGNIRAGRGAVNIFNAGAEEFSNVMGSMADSAGSADEAFRKMTDTGAYVEQQFGNAVENLKISIGNAQPSLDGLMTAGTAIMNSVSGFIEKNPKLVALIGAAAAALAVFTAAMVAHSAATFIAEKAMLAFTAAMATNPIFMAVAAFAALTVGLSAFCSTLDEGTERENRLTASSQELSDEIEKQEDVVKDLESAYGASNEKTLEAKAKLGELKAEYEATKMTVGEFEAQIRATSDAVAESTAKYDEAMSTLGDSGSHADVLITELQRLQSQGEKTAFQQEYEKQVIAELNGMYPDLGLSYDSVTGKLNMSTESLKKYCESKRQQLKLEKEAETYMEYMDEMSQYEDQMTTAQDNLNAAKERYNQLLAEGEAATLTTNEYGLNELEMAKIAMDDAQASVDGLSTKMGDLGDKMSAIDGSGAASSIEQVSQAAESVISTTPELQDAMTNIFNSEEVQSQATELVNAMQEAYDAAASAVDSSFGLFEKIQLDTSQSTQSMMEALESQKTYLDNYAQNLERASELKFDPKLISSLADGSQESAGKLQSLIDKTDELSKKGGDVKGFVDDMNKAFKDVEESKKTLSQTMTEMNEEVNKKMDKLVETMEHKVDDLNLDEEAGKAAEATIKAYAAGITRQQRAAVSAAEAVAAAVNAALAKAKVGGTSTAKHAAGTTYGENVYIAGEAGPELIVGREGSQVFPASETARILSAVMNSRDDREVEAAPQEIRETVIRNTTSSNTNTENRNMTITIKGKGALDIGQGVSRKDLTRYISEELEGAIVNILSREIYEEGAVAYEF